MMMMMMTMTMTTNETWDHKVNTHILWNTLSNLANKKPPQQPNRSISFNNKTYSTSKDISTQFNKQFTNATKHTTDKQNRIIDRATHKLETDTNLEITETEVKKAITLSENNKSTGPDNICILHLKHLGPIAISFLTKLFNLSLQQNDIPPIWKLAKIIPIPKSNKDPNIGSSYRPISLLSPIAKTMEKVILPHITYNIKNNLSQHGYKAHYSTTTALHKITDSIAKGFNKPQPPDRTIVVALDLSKAFDTVNIHTLIRKLQNTQIPPTIIKYIANYLKGRSAFTQFRNTTSAQKILKTGVPQGGVLSPVLFNIYTSDIPKPPPHVQLETYADDMNTLSSHQDIHTIEQRIQPYLDNIYTWTKQNDLQLNPDKSTATLFTPDPAQYSTEINLTINNNKIPTIKNPKILGLTLDPKLNFLEHIKTTKAKAN